MYTLAIAKALHEQLMRHLFQGDGVVEQAAFLFGRLDEPNAAVEVIEQKLLSPADYAVQTAYHIEVNDDARAYAIKRAHDLGAVLIEVHCHTFDGGGAFSWSDELGLREFAPHVLWRLPKRPYVAVVVAPGEYDALTWSDKNTAPATLVGMRVGDDVITPTGRSARAWGEGHGYGYDSR